MTAANQTVRSDSRRCRRSADRRAFCDTTTGAPIMDGTNSHRTSPSLSAVLGKNTINASPSLLSKSRVENEHLVRRSVTKTKRRSTRLRDESPERRDDVDSREVATPARSLPPRTPTKTPRDEHDMITPVRTSSRSIKRAAMTSSPLSRLPNSTSKAQMSPLCGRDRFIPNRSAIQFDLCSAAILSDEKRRVEYIEKVVTKQPRVDANTYDSNWQRSTQGATPLQTEFHQRMKSALFDIPPDQVESVPDFSLRRTASDSSAPSRSLASIISPNDGQRRLFNEDLAYASMPELIDEEVCENRPTRNILSFRSVAPLASRRQAQIDPFEQDQLRVLQRLQNRAEHGGLLANPAGPTSSAAARKIPSAPSRILDAPDLVDDYYLNLISWGDNNILAVALERCVYLWNADTGAIEHLLTLRGPDDYVTSVSWTNCEGHSKYLAVGTNSSVIQLWDTEALKLCRNLRGHTSRVGALAWNKQSLSSGSRDSLILQHDVRSAQHIVARYQGHTQEVCGLRWSDDGTSLASGGNENYLCIWDAAMSGRRMQALENASDITPRFRLTQHKAAVKALAWCPFHRGLLASGGGTADRCIKFWNTNSGALLNSVDTGSQVCSLLWSTHQRELCSSHGFSENQLILWHYPTMSKIQEFKGHSARVLHMEQSPDGASVVSAAADETLRFWDIFGAPPTKRPGQGLGKLSMGMPTIR